MGTTAQKTCCILLYLSGLLKGSLVIGTIMKGYKAYKGSTLVHHIMYDKMLC